MTVLEERPRRVGAVDVHRTRDAGAGAEEGAAEEPRGRVDHGDGAPTTAHAKARDGVVDELARWMEQGEKSEE